MNRGRVAAIAGVIAVAAVVAGVVVVTRPGDAAETRPAANPRPFAVRVVRLIVGNRYGEAWHDLHPEDRRVATRAEYVRCENLSRFTATFVRARTGRVVDESVGLGDGSFVRSKAVDVLVTLRDAGVPPFVVRHTVHLVATGERWSWILPSWRYRDFRAGRCPTSASSAPSESS